MIEIVFSSDNEWVYVFGKKNGWHTRTLALQKVQSIDPKATIGNYNTYKKKYKVNW